MRTKIIYLWETDRDLQKFVVDELSSCEAQETNKNDRDENPLQTSDKNSFGMS